MECGLCFRKGEVLGKQSRAALPSGRAEAARPDLAAPHTCAFRRRPFPRRAADLSEAEPTLTHMSIARLHEQKLVRTCCGWRSACWVPRAEPGRPALCPSGNCTVPLSAAGPGGSVPTECLTPGLSLSRVVDGVCLRPELLGVLPTLRFYHVVPTDLRSHLDKGEACGKPLKTPR